MESLAFFSQASEESPPNSMNGKQSSHVPRMESFTETEVLEPPEGKESFRCPRKVSFAETETPMERQVSSQSYPRMVSFTETEMMEPESMEDDLSFGMSDSEDPEHLELFPSNFSFLCELRAIGVEEEKHRQLATSSNRNACVCVCFTYLTATTVEPQSTKTAESRHGDKSTMACFSVATTRRPGPTQQLVRHHCLSSIQNSKHSSFAPGFEPNM